MTRPHFGKHVRELVAQKTAYHCFHCNQPLQQGWHVDHHPIPFRDIEDNICCCSVTDPSNIENLQPSCPSCNTSHRFEPIGKAMYCGRTQLYCSKTLTARCLYGLLLFASLGANVYQALN